MGVCVKGDRTKIVFILSHINMCDTVYFTSHLYNQYYLLIWPACLLKNKNKTFFFFFFCLFL